jgi:N-acetylglucosaminyldiphosphoundecaprenol N-acetyl-beta-D-mannosaminyltransferase
MTDCKVEHSAAESRSERRSRTRSLTPDPNRIRLLGVRFHNLTTIEAADQIEYFIREGQPRMILARNAAIRVMEDQDPGLQHIYETSDLVTVDGMAFVYLGRLLGRAFKEMTGGPAVWYELLRRAALKGYRVFFLGAREDILRKAVTRLQQQYPGLQVAGCHNGYFKAEEEDEIVETIRQSRAQILMVGMSPPLKERFLDKHLHRMGVPACIGIGGAIDLFAGVCTLAPTWMRILCLEWLYRVWQEPRRLLRRYVVSNTRFLLLVIKQLSGMGVRGAPNRV